MKTTFTFLIFGLLTLTSFGQNRFGNPLFIEQNQHFRLVGGPAGYNSSCINTDIRTGLSHPGNYAYQNKKALAIMQQLDTYEYKEYDAVGSIWVNSSLNEFTYDGGGNNTSDIFSSWNLENQNYELMNKKVLGYDENGNRISDTDYSWDETSGEWIQAYRYLYTYNTEGNLTIGYSYFWDETTTSWEMSGRIERSYDMYGNLTEEINSWWDMSTSQWMNSSKTENSYNVNNLIIESIFYMWDFMGNDWMNMSKTEYTYNSYDFLTLLMDFQWNSTSNQWVYDYKDEFTYDSNMNMIQDMEYEWNGSVWVVSGKYEYNYNNDFTFNELILPWFFEQGISGLQHMLLDITEYSGSSFELTGKSIFNYSEVNITGIENVEADQIGVYPQPASSVVSFNWESISPELRLEVYDVSHRKLIDQTVRKNATTSVSQLSPGIYVYRLLGSKNEIYSGKLSVR